MDNLYKKLRMLRHASQECQDYVLIKTEIHGYNTRLKRSIRGAKKIYFEKCFNVYKANMMKTLLTINDIVNRNKNKTSLPDVVTVNGKQVTDKATIANHFNNFFTNIRPELANKMHNPINVYFKKYLSVKHNSEFSFKRST